jgi:urea transport system ATP-binding protein
MKPTRDYLQGRSLEEVAAAARAYEASHAPFDKRPLKARVQPPRAMLEKPRIALYLERISVSFDGFKALNDLTFYVDEGELRCVIAPTARARPP